MPPIFEDVMLAIFYEISMNEKICNYGTKHILGGENIEKIDRYITKNFIMPHKLPPKFNKNFFNKNFLVILDGNLYELEKYLERNGYKRIMEIQIDKGKIVHLYEKSEEKYKKYILVIEGKIEDILEIPHIRIDKSYKKRDKIEEKLKEKGVDLDSLKQKIKSLQIAELLNRLSKDLNI